MQLEDLFHKYISNIFFSIGGLEWNKMGSFTKFVLYNHNRVMLFSCFRHPSYKIHCYDFSLPLRDRLLAKANQVDVDVSP